MDIVSLVLACSLSGPINDEMLDALARHESFYTAYYVRPMGEAFGVGYPTREEGARAAQQVTTCCINLTGEAMVDEGFIGFVAERLRSSSFPASKLCLEITETSAVRDLARAQRFINEMRALGCRFALDDFGTGFCSFSYLRSLDVEYFKIDGSFVREMDTSPLAAEVVRSITHIAHLLDKRTIAEHTANPARPRPTMPSPQPKR